MTRVLVTGGTGYVGARLAAGLACRAGTEVVVTTRNTPAPLDYLPGVQVVQVDYADPATLRPAMEGVDCVFHLAAANEIICGQNHQRAVKDNVLDALNVLDAAVASGVGRFVNFSTAHVYGVLEGRITEDSPTNPIHPYAITHLAFEHFLRLRDSRGEIEGVNIRLSNAVGAPQHAAVDRWTLVANDLCRMAVTMGELRLKSDGTQNRDFVALSDVVRIAIALGEVPRDRLGDGTVNLGSGRTTTVGDLARMVQAAFRARMGRDIALHFGPPSEATGASLEFAVDRLHALGLGPKTPLEDEVEALLSACFRFFDR